MVEARDRRIPIMFSEEELFEIEEWRHNNRIATRAGAVRRLCKIALFLDEQLDDVLDVTNEGVTALSNHSKELSEVFRLLINRETYGATFDRDQLWDVFTLAREQADVAERGMRGLHAVMFTLYTAVAAITEAKTVHSARTQLQEVIAKANAVIDEANAQRAEQERISEENRYLALVMKSETAEDRAAFEALDEDAQDAYLDQKINQLKQDEEADPEAFALRFGLDERKFWEKPEWVEFLEQRAEQSANEESEK